MINKKKKKKKKEIGKAYTKCSMRSIKSPTVSLEVFEEKNI